MLLREYVKCFENGKCPLHIVWNIGKQLLEQLHDLHETTGSIHGYLDDEHVIIVPEKDELRVQLKPSKFGAKSFRSKKTGHHIKNYLVERDVSLNFAGIDAHRGSSPSRRDDLQSLAYLLIWLTRGELPWQFIITNKGKENWAAILHLKRNNTSERFRDKLPILLVVLFDYSNMLQFDELPGYNYLIDQFKENLDSALEKRKQKFNKRKESIAGTLFLPDVLITMIVSYTMH